MGSCRVFAKHNLELRGRARALLDQRLRFNGYVQKKKKAIGLRTSPVFKHWWCLCLDSCVWISGDDDLSMAMITSIEDVIARFANLPFHERNKRCALLCINCSRILACPAYSSSSLATLGQVLPSFPLLLLIPACLHQLMSIRAWPVILNNIYGGAVLRICWLALRVSTCIMTATSTTAGMSACSHFLLLLFTTQHDKNLRFSSRSCNSSGNVTNSMCEILAVFFITIFWLDPKTFLRGCVWFFMRIDWILSTTSTDRNSQNLELVSSLLYYTGWL